MRVVDMDTEPSVVAEAAAPRRNHPRQREARREAPGAVDNHYRRFRWCDSSVHHMVPKDQHCRLHRPQLGQTQLVVVAVAAVAAAVAVEPL